MTRIHGRKDQPLEYVEFRCVNKSGRRVTFAAQRAGDLWHTYEMAKGAGLRIHRANCRSLKQAEAVIRKAATVFESQ